ncbi:DNA polymerase III subunit beta [Phocoenobacter skyensis]|uniref:Beta sliding clamp n=1 Tax=Phocoenobacter skyensis TaxID=97481 RepID=A0A1H7XS81_9PAST|nr:DNA polymerase III subunit beta [Pasteurella skyensis]MDP8161838.1 DNA polymerase III subunit beta [Pasteurella skyensis]MDP8171994.1 DNA polymerase III subunit beta [Pasteurella skyensis]MDP8175734.1 DNA polymerase III subunit beta [Pasteurella skyensis]MDP8176229.1 DNA polymerase III subunit beta [Pasteurella skyensis]MDP8178249.1 DNA polymerase III subunit beta [Pasteurella skyensis]
MQFTITREKLLKPLQQVCSVLNSRPTLPIIGNVLLEIKGNQLFLTCTDLEVELTTQAELTESLPSEAKFTIPARKFLDICKSLPEDSVIAIKFEEGRALIQASRSKFNLATLPASDYPSLMDWNPEVDFNIAQATLTRLIEATQFSMANQDARYFLNGMKFETEGNLLRTVATDGHRLAVCTMPLEQELPSHSVIVPRKAVIELSRLLISSDEAVRLEIGSNHIRISMNNIVFTSKLIDGRFPDYRRVLPRNADRILESDTEVLKRALVRAAILSNERFRGVRLVLTNNLLKITANNPEQEEAEEIIDVAYQNIEMEVGFNVSYLLDVLNALKCERVRINLVDSASSCLIEDCDNNTAEYVIMPMRL